MTTVTHLPVRTRETIADKPGCVALPTSEIGRFMLFTMSLTGTQQPSGSRLHAAASASVTENTNSIIRDMLPTEKWVWLLGDDHVWPGDTLQCLLATMDAHPEIDILVPLVTKRNPPWHLVLYHVPEGERNEDGIQLLKALDWTEVPESGVFEVEAAGSAGMLIRAEVLDALGDPWFYSTPNTDGKQVILNEDVTFCIRAREEGFRVFATADVVLGHLGIFNVRPMKRDGRWGALTEFSSADEQFKHLFMPVEQTARGGVIELP